MSVDRHILVGVLLYLVAVAGPALVIWAAVRLVPVVFALLFGWLHRLAARSPSPGMPSARRLSLRAQGRPGREPSAASFEQTVRDLHRLRAELLGPPQGTNVRRVALLAAYDDVLLTLCRQVGIDPGLDGAPVRGATEAERAFLRLQTEAAVEAAGVVLDPPRAGPTAV